QLARRLRIGPGFGVGHGYLRAVGPAGFHARALLAIDHHDVVARLIQPPRRRNADDAAAQYRNFHLLTPLLSGPALRGGNDCRIVCQAASAAVVKASAKNSLSGRPQAPVKSCRALSTMTGAPQA